VKRIKEIQTEHKELYLILLRVKVKVSLLLRTARRNGSSGCTVLANMNFGYKWK